MDYALPHRRRADSGAERPIMIRQCGLKEGLSLTTRFRNLLAMVWDGVRFLKCWGRGRVIERPLSLTARNKYFHP